MCWVVGPRDRNWQGLLRLVSWLVPSEPPTHHFHGLWYFDKFGLKLKLTEDCSGALFHIFMRRLWMCCCVKSLRFSLWWIFRQPGFIRLSASNYCGNIIEHTATSRDKQPPPSFSHVVDIYILMRYWIFHFFIWGHLTPQNEPRALTYFLGDTL